MKLLLVAALGAVFAVAAYVLGNAVLLYPAAWLTVGVAFLVLHLVVSARRPPATSADTQGTASGSSHARTTLQTAEDDEAQSGAVAATKA